MIALLEVLFVVGLVVAVVYGASAAFTGLNPPRPSGVAGARWVTAHYAAGESTKVVVRKVVPATGEVVDEHQVAVIEDSDPDYDEKFLEAMALARSRAALFESES